jgi:hypothetical protein
MLSPQRCRDTRSILESLIEEWIPKLAINAGAALDARTQAVFKALWLEGLEDVPPDALRAALVKTLRECAFWPVKVADIRKHIDDAEEKAEAIAAEQAWQIALNDRRRDWFPDLPGGRASHYRPLPERIQASIRVAGVLQDYDDPDQLHVWCKKKFIEYYLQYGEMEREGKFLIAQGELREALAAISETKVLPPAGPSFDELHRRGLEYSARVRESESKPPTKWAFTLPTVPVVPVESRIAELERQKTTVLAKYPRKEKTATA